VLRKGDVLMEFDGVVIANDGTVHFRARERIFFTSLITMKPTGSTARVKVRFVCGSCSVFCRCLLVLHCPTHQS
jgi:hypothetical protein